MPPDSQTSPESGPILSYDAGAPRPRFERGVGIYTRSIVGLAWVLVGAAVLFACMLGPAGYTLMRWGLKENWVAALAWTALPVVPAAYVQWRAWRSRSRGSAWWAVTVNAMAGAMMSGVAGIFGLVSLRGGAKGPDYVAAMLCVPHVVVGMAMIVASTYLARWAYALRTEEARPSRWL